MPVNELIRIAAVSLGVGFFLGVMALPKGLHSAVSWFLCSTVACTLFGILSYQDEGSYHDGNQNGHL